MRIRRVLTMAEVYQGLVDGSYVVADLHSAGYAHVLDHSPGRCRCRLSLDCP